jgi:hypothetical protein
LFLYALGEIVNTDAFTASFTNVPGGTGRFCVVTCQFLLPHRREKPGDFFIGNIFFPFLHHFSGGGKKEKRGCIPDSQNGPVARRKKVYFEVGRKTLTEVLEVPPVTI